MQVEELEDELDDMAETDSQDDDDDLFLSPTLAAATPLTRPNRTDNTASKSRASHQDSPSSTVMSMITDVTVIGSTVKSDRVSGRGSAVDLAPRDKSGVNQSIAQLGSTRPRNVPAKKGKENVLGSGLSPGLVARPGASKGLLSPVATDKSRGASSAPDPRSPSVQGSPAVSAQGSRSSFSTPGSSRGGSVGSGNSPQSASPPGGGEPRTASENGHSSMRSSTRSTAKKDAGGTGPARPAAVSNSVLQKELQDGLGRQCVIWLTLLQSAAPI